MRILFVCMGNICRSPTAEGVMRRCLREAGLDGRVEVDSAGTHAYHVGEPPDVRSQKAAKARGVDLSRLRARRVDPRDFETFDLILAMDRRNLEALRAECPPWYHAKLGLFVGEGEGGEVPDPYYGGPQGFEVVLDLVENASRSLVASLLRQGVAGGVKSR